MATDADESLLEDLDIYESQIVRLQAYIRGSLVRKWISQIKQDYVDLFYEIEQSNKNIVQWPYRSLCYPVIQKKSRKKVSRSNQSSPRSDLSENLNKIRKENTFDKDWKDLESKNSTPRSDVAGSTRGSSTDFHLDDIGQNQTSSPKLSLTEMKNADSQTDLKILNTSCASQDSEHSRIVDVKAPLCKSDEVYRDTIPKQRQMEVDYNLKDENDINKQLCSVETQTSMYENFDSKSVNTSELDDKNEHTNVNTQIGIVPELHESKADKAKENSKYEKTVMSMDSVESVQESDHESQKFNRHRDQLDMSDKEGHKNNIELDGISLQPPSEHIERRKDVGHHRSDTHRPEMISRTTRQPELSVTSVTSVWDSVSSLQDVTEDTADQIYPTDQESLQEMRKNIAMELLWIQQAINSRKNYLRLKNQMELLVTT